MILHETPMLNDADFASFLGDIDGQDITAMENWFSHFGNDDDDDDVERLEDDQNFNILINLEVANLKFDDGTVFRQINPLPTDNEKNWPQEKLRDCERRKLASLNCFKI